MDIFDSKLGQTILTRLEQESLIWLTTVDSSSTPQPRPVWFHWDGQTVMIFSMPGAAKLRHIARNPRVALNFNTDAGGGSVGVLIGEAAIGDAPTPQRLQAYLQKYEQGIQEIEQTPEGMQAAYSAVIRITPLSLRGF